jgi:hypothetical protein
MAIISAFISEIGTPNDAERYSAKPMNATLKIYATKTVSNGLA